ncbi:MAG: hypothetical protein K2O32_15430 [Acetatifactor sp.]|nr:hypothetical protein [Acetatifactor sp.]
MDYDTILTSKENTFRENFFWENFSFYLNRLLPILTGRYLPKLLAYNLITAGRKLPLCSTTKERYLNATTNEREKKDTNGTC